MTAASILRSQIAAKIAERDPGASRRLSIGVGKGIVVVAGCLASHEQKHRVLAEVQRNAADLDFVDRIIVDEPREGPS